MPTAPLALPPSIDTHQALGSPSGRAGAKRLRGLTAPILPTGYPQNHRTDFSYETAFLHKLSAHPSPPPFGRYLSRRERQELRANLKQPHKPQFNAPSIDAHRTLGSPSGRAGAKRLRGLTAPIPIQNYVSPITVCTTFSSSVRRGKSCVQTSSYSINGKKQNENNKGEAISKWGDHFEIALFFSGYPKRIEAILHFLFAVLRKQMDKPICKIMVN